MKSRQYRILVERLTENLDRDPSVREIALGLLAEGEDTRDYETLFSENIQSVGPIERELLHRMEEHVKQLRFLHPAVSYQPRSIHGR